MYCAAAIMILKILLFIKILMILYVNRRPLINPMGLKAALYSSVCYGKTNPYIKDIHENQQVLSMSMAMAIN